MISFDCVIGEKESLDKRIFFLFLQKLVIQLSSIKGVTHRAILDVYI